MASKGSLCSQEQATGPCLEPDEFCPHPQTLFPSDPLQDCTLPYVVFILHIF